MNVSNAELWQMIVALRKLLEELQLLRYKRMKDGLMANMEKANQVHIEDLNNECIGDMQ